MTVPHPIPYQGSKRNLAPIILDYIPEDTQRLIEPFAGSAALSLAAAQAQRAQAFVLNDINQPLITLWHAIINNPDSLAEGYKQLWYAQQGQERVFYNLVRDRFNQSKQPADLLYLLARCVKASIRYNAKGDFNQSPDNRRKGRQPGTMRRDILQAAELLNNKTTLLSQDYREALRDIDPLDVVYLDPPYQGVTSNRDPRYIQGLSLEEFVDTLADLNARQIAYIVSYDGRTGNKKFGDSLPHTLSLTHIEIDAGRSSQSTLLGRNEKTYESLYLSPTLMSRLEMPSTYPMRAYMQLSLFGDLV
jgi:DNA adenine methylase